MDDEIKCFCSLCVELNDMTAPTSNNFDFIN